MTDEEIQNAPPLEIPPDALSVEVLCNLIDAFIWREGTDYGAEEASHEQKVKAIRRQLEEASIQIIYDPNTDSVTLMTRHQFQRMLESSRLP